MKKWSTLINENQQDNNVNLAFQEAAKNEGIELIVGYNNRVGNVIVEPVFEAVAVNEDFVKALKVFGADIHPSLPQLMHTFDVTSDDQIIRIQTEESTYEAKVELDILSKRLDLWVNLNDVKEMVNKA